MAIFFCGRHHFFSLEGCLHHDNKKRWPKIIQFAIVTGIYDQGCVSLGNMAGLFFYGTYSIGILTNLPKLPVKRILV